MKILVIEDDKKIRQMLMDQLAAEDVDTVYEAGNFTEALAVIRDADGVLCDDQFPIWPDERPFDVAWMALRDAAQQLRKPFVLLTADPDTRLEALCEDTPAYIKNKQASEAIAQLVRAVGKAPRLPEHQEEIKLYEAKAVDFATRPRAAGIVPPFPQRKHGSFV